MSSYEAIHPDEFMGKDFMECFTPFVDKYIKLRALGRTGRAALRTSFGEVYVSNPRVQSYIDRIECSAYYLFSFPRVLAQMKESQLWSPKIAAVELVSIAQDQCAKEANRIAAIKELNVIFGITVVDEAGKTRAGRSFADFYKDVAQVPGTPVKHYPEPGTPEAEMYVEETRH